MLPAYAVKHKKLDSGKDRKEKTMKKKYGVFFGFIVMIIAMTFTLAGCDNGTNGTGSNFIPVTDITDIPRISLTNLELALGGVVLPSNATNQTITWSGANVADGKFTVATAGDHEVIATVANGLSEENPYTKTFIITVYNSTEFQISEIQGDWTKPSTAGFGSATTDTMTITGSEFEMKNDSIGNMVYAKGIILSATGTGYKVQLNAISGNDGQLRPSFFYEEGTYTYTATNPNTITITTDASYGNGVSPAKGTWTEK
jgi:predicted small secreted protein